MDILNGKGFFVDDWLALPAEGVLSRGDELEHLEPKVMEVLVYFASRAGEVITREELERDVWHGALVGYDAVTATVIKLRKALQDNAKQPRIIATIPKKGYQLIAPVSLADTNNLASVTTPAHGPAPVAKVNRLHSVFIPGLIGIVIIAAAVLIGYGLQQGSPQHTALPSIVVLPIENLGTSTEHDVFVDGITEDIITDLSRMSNLMVFASTTSFKYKGRTITPQTLHDELKVDFVLRGNLRRYDNKIRFNVQLVNAATGFNVWARRYDRKTTDIFAVQDEMTTSLIDALAIKLSPQEKQRLAQRATHNLKAYEYFQEGQRLSRDQTKTANAQAREAYKQAIAIDPTYGRAYGALAYTLAYDYRRGWTNTPVENLERALSLAEQGVTLDGSIPQTYWSLGYVYLRRGEYKNALKATAESIRIAPNYADGYGLLALISNGMGQSEKALQYANRGMQLNPYYTWDYLFNVGYAQYFLGHYDLAIASLEKAQERNENAIPVKLYLAACYVRAGRISDAEWVVEQLQVLNPEMTLSHAAKTGILTDPRRKLQLLNDLRKAGLPQ